MYTKVNLYEFQEAFERQRPDNFTAEGLRLLFGYVEGLEGQQQELDVIALCCEFTEYLDLQEALESAGVDFLDEEAIAEFVRERVVNKSELDYKIPIGSDNGPVTLVDGSEYENLKAAMDDECVTYTDEHAIERFISDCVVAGDDITQFDLDAGPLIVHDH